MSVSLFQRRRVERFAQLIDEADGGRRHHTRSRADRRLEPLVSVTRRMSDLPLVVEAHQEFREGLRAMLMATIEREGIGATADPQEDPSDDRGFASAQIEVEVRRVRRRARAIGVAVASLAAGAVAVSGVSTASDHSRPGDALYPLKRSAERAQLAIANSDISRGQLFLDFAKTRLDEAKAVRDDPARFDSVLDDMDQETKEGVRLLTKTALDRQDGQALDAIDTFVAAQRQDLGALLRDLSGISRARGNTSAELLQRVTTRSTALRPLLPCGMASAGPADDLGPTPKGSCDLGRPAGEGPGQDRQRSPRAGSPSPVQDPSASGGRPSGSQPQDPDQPQTKSNRSSTPALDPIEGSGLNGDPCDVIGCPPG